jgi:hypothetical protein
MPKENEMQENRALKRRALTYQLEVLDVESGDVLGRLVDLTAEGILLVGPRAVGASARHLVRMALPEEIFGKNHVDFAVEAVWSRPDVSPSHFLSGYRIVEAPAEDLERIVCLIARHVLPV